MLSMDENENMMSTPPAPGDAMAPLAGTGAITSSPRRTQPRPRVNAFPINSPNIHSDDDSNGDDDDDDDVMPHPPALESASDRMQRPGAVHVPTRAPFVSNHDHHHHHHHWRERMSAHLRAPFRSTRTLSVRRSMTSGATGGRGPPVPPPPNGRSSFLSRISLTPSSRQSWVVDDPDAVGASCENNDPTPAVDDREAFEGDVKKGIALICLAGLLLVGIVVAVTLAVVSSGEGSDTNLNSVPTTAAAAAGNLPTGAPTMASASSGLLFTEREIALQTRFREYSSDPSIIFADYLSPQSLAISWLANSNDGALNASQEDDLDVLESRYALACFYFATTTTTTSAVASSSSNRTGWTNNLHFLTSSHVCEWNDGDHEGGMGIFCNDQGKVVQLIFDQPNNLQGFIPEEIKILANHLQVVKISHQSREDQPDLQQIQQFHQLGALTNLQILDLSDNHWGGGIPSSFANLLFLEELYLNDNQLVGQLPDDMDKLESMRILHMHNNLLFGSANPGVYAMTDLVELRMDGNNKPNAGLQTVQEFWLGLTQLRVWNFNGVQISQEQPRLRQLDRLSSLEVFDWDEGGISGGLASFALPANLTSLSLHDNALTGDIPWESLTPRLQYLDLGFNLMSGSIPSLTVERLVNLEYLNIADNSLTGTVPVAALASLTNLELLRLEGNLDLVVGNLEPLCTAVRPTQQDGEETTRRIDIVLAADSFSVANCSCCIGC